MFARTFKLGHLALLLFLAVPVGGQAYDISYGDILNEMTDPAFHANWPKFEYTCRQSSSYSRESVTPATAEEDGRFRPESGRDWSKGWFENHDFNNYYREEKVNGRTEYVMHEDDGPGVIVRFWAAYGGVTNEANGGEYLIYIDGASEPVVKLPVKELVGGTGLVAYPFSYVAPAKTENYTWLGRNLVLPITYGKSCKISYLPPSESNTPNTHGHYYQINYRSYKDGVKVESFTEETMRKYAGDIYACGVRLTGDMPVQTDEVTKAGGCALASKESKTLVLEGEKCITSLSMQLGAEDISKALRNTVLKIKFDGEQTVDCPVGNFYGIGPRQLSNNTFYVRTRSDGMMTVYWVMPFGKKAEVTLTNNGKENVDLKVFQTTSKPYNWDPARSMHFHAFWHQTKNIDSDIKFDYNYVTIEGKGRYVGDGLEIYNYHPDYHGDSWWGEGDEKIFVDGETFPSHFGTGTEDYYSYAYCRPQPFSYPSISQPTGEGNKKPGLSVNNRYRLLDDIPFGKSFAFFMEIWHAYYSPIDYAPATFWYAFPGCKWHFDPGHLDKAENGPVTTDKQLFNLLDLKKPGLEAVRDDVKKGDIDAAKHDFVKYLKTRNNVNWYFDWRDGLTDKVRDPGYDTTAADKYASNLLVSTGFWHQFGPVVDWHANPTPNEYHEWTWQLSRHPFWEALGKAYWATGDEKYARAFVSQMRSWVDQNPLPNHAADGPYSCWRTIEAGIRTLGAWPASFLYFLSSPSFDDDSIIMMVKSFYEHTQLLLAYPKTNNWLTMEMDGLFHTAMLFPEFKDAAYWAEYASGRLYGEENIQFYPDGSQMELSTGYHGTSVSNIMKIVPIARLNNYPLPEGFVAGMEKAYQFYENLMMPDGNYPALNDSGWGSSRTSLVAACEYFPGKEDFKYIATEGKEGKEPDFTSCWMPWAGWYNMRSGWDADALYANMEVGPFGAGHQHEDKLSVVASAYGRRLLTEGGIYAYDTSEWRKYVLSARAHNVARIDGGDQHRGYFDELETISEPLTNRWESNESFDFGEGWYTEGFGPDRDSTVTHYRALAFLKKQQYWILVDVFTPKDTKVHTYDTWFHFNSESCVPVLGGYTTADAGLANLAIIPLDAAGVTSKVIKGQTEPEYQGWDPEGPVNVSVCRPIATPTFHQEGAGTTVVPYILCPSKPGEEVRVSKVKSLGRGQYKIYFKDGSCDKLSLTFDGHSLSGFSLNGKLF